ncbi:hypothetical protein CASFOL_008811 [Castilleja foliolosa]|uniref:Uncharacterized protein n=1 Tax=Castilleja foliolosa TaxID=1961234 RepID=A0ABD3E022_9LAMI
MASYKFQIFCVLLIAAIFSEDKIAYSASSPCPGEIHDEVHCSSYQNGTMTPQSVTDCTTCCKQIFGDDYSADVQCNDKTQGIGQCICNMCQANDSNYKHCSVKQ